MQCVCVCVLLHSLSKNVKKILPPQMKRAVVLRRHVSGDLLHLGNMNCSNEFRTSSRVRSSGPGSWVGSELLQQRAGRERVNKEIL